MGDKITLKLTVRELHGKKVRQLRHEGIVPAIVYGSETEPISVQASYSEVERVWRHAGKHTPVQLTIDTKKHIAMIKDVDYEPSKHRIRHISFHAVKANEPVVAVVPIRLVGEGESEAERAGLVVLQSLESIEVRALPMELPEALEVSILGLKVAGDHITLGDITIPENVELVEHKSGHSDQDDEDAPQLTDLTVATVYEPSALQAANEAAGGDAEDESEVEAEHGEDTDQGAQSSEDQPGGKGQDDPKQSNADANK
ncbi:MAG: ribosomal protein [Candidatus Saccharibacteria bacterium]|nr:ribosomal protein [Candidatus Saccharibacteria bacterium]